MNTEQFVVMFHNNKLPTIIIIFIFLRRLMKRKCYF